MIPLAINNVPIDCINQAAISYKVPATLIISVLKTENGHIGTASKNKNGSYDFGPMQINTAWLHRLAPYGITQHDVQYDPCINIAVGAWILAANIANSDQPWRGVGNYNSAKPKSNQEYQVQVAKWYKRIQSF